MVHAVLITVDFEGAATSISDLVNSSVVRIMLASSICFLLIHCHCYSKNSHAGHFYGGIY